MHFHRNGSSSSSSSARWIRWSIRRPRSCNHTRVRPPPQKSTSLCVPRRCRRKIFSRVVRRDDDFTVTGTADDNAIIVDERTGPSWPLPTPANNRISFRFCYRRRTYRATPIHAIIRHGTTVHRAVELRGLDSIKLYRLIERRDWYFFFLSLLRWKLTRIKNVSIWLAYFQFAIHFRRTWDDKIRLSLYLPHPYLYSCELTTLHTQTYKSMYDVKFTFKRLNTSWQRLVDLVVLSSRDRMNTTAFPCDYSNLISPENFEMCFGNKNFNLNQNISRHSS